MKVKKKYINPKAKNQLRTLTVMGGLERSEFFANGGTATQWMGGTVATFKNRKSEASRKACRLNNQSKITNH